MRGLPRLPGLEARLRAVLRARALEALVGTVLALLALWCLGQLVFIIAGAPAASNLTLLVVLLSLLPLGLLLPPPPGLLDRALRTWDRDATVEALRSAPPGPARDLLALRAKAEDEARVRDRLTALPGPRPWARPGVRSLAGAAALAFLLLQLVAVVLLRHPLLAWRGPAAEGASYAALLGQPPAAREEGRPSPQGTEAEDSGPGREAQARGGHDAEATENADSGDLQGRGRTGALPQPSPDLLSGEGPDRGGRILSLSSGDRGSGEASRGLSSEGGARDNPGDGRGPARGYEASGRAAAPSPLMDYLARRFGVATQGPGKAQAATSELGLAQLRDFSRRFFQSFNQDPGLETRESGEALALKARWKALRKELK